MTENGLATIVIPGTPGHWRRSRTNGKRHFMAPKSREERDRIIIHTRRTWTGKPVQGPVSVSIDAFYRCPKQRPKCIGKEEWQNRDEPFEKPTRPDLDNVAKQVLDALNGVVWDDDSQVCDLRIRKRYAARDSEPATLILIRWEE